jgi:two-component system, OmpR family, phosphate regulon sensor histidine kinase PhoR
MTFLVVLIALLLFLLAVAALAWSRERSRRHAMEARHRLEMAEWDRRGTAAINEQAERSAALFDRMVEGVIVTSATGRIRLANRAAVAFFGFDALPVGRTLLEATRRHEMAVIATRLEQEAEVLGHELLLEGAGSARCLQVNALALRDAGGGRDGFLFVFHEVTRLRHLEAMRQEFVANVSHELRTPLSLIKSAAETMLDSGQDDPAMRRRFLEIIDRHANRLTRLIDDLLLLSTLDSGRVRLELQPISLRAAVQEVVDDFQIRARVRGVAIDNQVAGNLVVRADPDRLRQVLANLVDNAIKYGRDDGQVTLAGLVAADGRVEVSIHDDGPGLPVEAQPRIFERFYRVDKARSREQGGTGLGLAIVKHVVQAHGGEVRVESRPGAGTTFCFTLPAELPPAAAPAHSPGGP